MSIKLKGSSDGSVSFDAPADTSPSGSDITLTLPTSAGSANQFLKNSGIAGELEYSSMVENSSGNVGIGTTNPIGDLSVVASGGSGMEFQPEIATDTNRITNFNRSSSTYNNFRLDAKQQEFLISGTEKARIDSSGRLLVGTTSSKESLSMIQCVRSSDSTLSVFTSDTSASGQAKINLGPSNNITGAQIICVAEEDFSVSANRTARLELHTRKDGTLVKRMRILPHGSVRCGTSFSDSDYLNNTTDYWHVFQHHTNNQAGFIIEHTGNHNPYGLIIDFSDSHPDDNTHYFMSCIDQQAIRLQIKSDGDIDNHDNSYSGFSDVKLKQDIVDAGSQWDDIKNLRVRKFRFKSDVAEHGDEAKTLIGVVAQETELVSPGLVKESPDLDKYNNDLGTTTKSVRYSVLYMKAVKALQEAQTRIETLETQNAAQQAQIDDLLARVTALEAA